MAQNKSKNANNPANGLEKNTLSAEGIIALIKASHDAGVTLLKFGDLELEFGPRKPKTAEHPGTEIPEHEQKKIDEKNLAEQELSFRREQVANMLVEDPVKAEELIASGELVPDDDDGRVESDDE